MAYSDILTGLPNRALVSNRLRDAVSDAQCSDSGLAVLMADLDGLKRANDTYGHQAGDSVLKVTAQRFVECVRETDTVARLGGDEFCIVLPGVAGWHIAETVAARLVEAARQPIFINGRDVRIGRQEP